MRQKTRSFIKFNICVGAVIALALAPLACKKDKDDEEKTFVVTPTGDSHLTLAPTEASVVKEGETLVITITAASPFVASETVGGSCPQGTWNGTSYTTAAIVADCTVTFSSIDTTAPTYTVTASGDDHETISPAGASTVSLDGKVSITVTGATGYQLSPEVGGTCAAGTWSAGVYTTGAITADCSVIFKVYTATFTNGQAAAQVIGQADFTTSATGLTATALNTPFGNVAVSDSSLYIPERYNYRVLGFSTIPAANTPSADFAIGQTVLTSNAHVFGATTLSEPMGGASLYNGKLAVADTGNSRVLIYNTAPTGFNPTPDVAVGKTSLTSGGSACSQTTLQYPDGVFMGAGKLIVSSAVQNRIMIWNTIPTTNGAAADLVLGQADFTTCTSNRGGSTAANSLNNNRGSTWTDGQRLVVADEQNNRVLIWNTFPTTNGQAADIVLGQDDFVSGYPNPGGSPSSSVFWNPHSVTSNGVQLFVSDSANNRILIWNTFPTTTKAAADVVLGQTSMSAIGATTATATSLYRPDGVTIVGKKLYVTDTSNNRVLMYQGQ